VLGEDFGFSDDQVNLIRSTFNINDIYASDLAFIVVDFELINPDALQAQMRCNRNMERLTHRVTSEFQEMMKLRNGPHVAPLFPKLWIGECSWRTFAEFGVDSGLLEKFSSLHKVTIEATTGEEIPCVALFLADADHKLKLRKRTAFVFRPVTPTFDIDSCKAEVILNEYKAQ
jgi:hypothetical protein